MSFVMARPCGTPWAASRVKEDSPLTELGIRQADDVAWLLQQEVAEATSFELQVSPLGRTQETARRVLNMLPMARRDDARLMEVMAGVWE